MYHRLDSEKMSKKKSDKIKDKGRRAAEAVSEFAAPAAFGADDRPYPYEESMDRGKYEKRIVKLQIELLKVQRWVKETGQRVVVLFEGRDAAGKGGTIKRFAEYLNPRGARVVALPKPNETELGQWYFQRYVGQLPTAGEIVFFDRSWYNRAGVEPVMGFCTAEQYARFMHQVPAMEHGFIDANIRLFKLWFDVSRQVQKDRIKSRKTDPLKQWKLSPLDDESMQRWDSYTKARDAMFLLTDTRESPWTVVRSDDKRRARIGAMLTVLNNLPYPDRDPDVVQPADPLIVGRASEMYPVDGRFMFKID